ncbi:hypothetical protein BpHYR1_002126 [Brachionus plicatilis]|uniref:Uncharacterized protein n=1 Tax=Brachionus plicatilis TaxID=10195 RepID=A0A3M7RWV3_BRAPC|nr:hypothetical protein BpHYR1_002126 [Brachionus plicatilis]
MVTKVGLGCFDWHRADEAQLGVLVIIQALSWRSRLCAERSNNFWQQLTLPDQYNLWCYAICARRFGISLLNESGLLRRHAVLRNHNNSEISCSVARTCFNRFIRVRGIRERNKNKTWVRRGQIT